MSLGAAPLDSKALTVLSLDTVKSMSNGQATKIIFPFELTKLMEGASEYLGIARQTPATQISRVEDVERAVGKIDRILGPIPTVDELKESLKSVELTMEQERIDAEAIAEITKPTSSPRVVPRRRVRPRPPVAPARSRATSSRSATRSRSIGTRWRASITPPTSASSPRRSSRPPA